MQAESFGYKNAWFAAHNVAPDAVAKALSLRNVRGCKWTDGVTAAYEYPIACSVFIAPAIDDWVISVGFPFFALADARPPVFGLRAAELAGALQTEVQYFATHRVVEAHAWARAYPGGLERAYLFVGESAEKVLDFGAQTTEEQALGFAFFDPSSSAAETEGYWERDDLANVGEEHVMMLAARWSVDPSALTDRNVEVGNGLVGEFGEPIAAPPPRPPTRKPWWKVW